MAIERLDLATALGIAVYRAFFITMFTRPSFGGSLYDRNGYLPFKPPFGPREVALGRQYDCIHSAGGHIAGGVGYDLRHSIEGFPSGV